MEDQVQTPEEAKKTNSRRYTADEVVAVFAELHTKVLDANARTLFRAKQRLAQIGESLINS